MTLKDTIVIYIFKIIKWEFFTSKAGQDFLRINFWLSNENEEFEEMQVFLVEENGDIHSSFNNFVDQFRQHTELKDDITLDDFIGESGTCYIHTYSYYGKTYRKIMITSLGE